MTPRSRIFCISHLLVQESWPVSFLLSCCHPWALPLSLIFVFPQQRGSPGEGWSRLRPSFHAPYRDPDTCLLCYMWGKPWGYWEMCSGVRPCWDLGTVCLPMKRLAGGITKANVCTVPLGESGVCHCRSGSWIRVSQLRRLSLSHALWWIVSILSW